MVRNVLLVALATAALSLPLTAQLYIGCPDTNPASSATNNSYPMGSYTEWRYQYMLPASCFPNSPFLIADMAFAQHGGFKSSHPGTYGKFQIRMALTKSASLSNNFAANLGPSPVTVMSRTSLKWAWLPDKWVDLGLDAKFLYDGSSNVVIEIRYTGGSSSSIPMRAESPSGGYRAYTRGAGAFNSATATGLGRTSLPKTRFTIEVVTLAASGTPNPGGSVNFDLAAPGDAGLAYQLGSSLGTGPIPIDSRKLGLSPDDMLVASVSGALPWIFNQYAGVLDAAGKGKATLNIPSIPALIGTRIHSAFLTINATSPSGVKSISPTETFTITR